MGDAMNTNAIFPARIGLGTWKWASKPQRALKEITQ